MISMGCILIHWLLARIVFILTWFARRTHLSCFQNFWKEYTSNFFLKFRGGNNILLQASTSFEALFVVAQFSLRNGMGQSLFFDIEYSRSYRPLYFITSQWMKTRIFVLWSSYIYYLSSKYWVFISEKSTMMITILINLFLSASEREL